MGSHPSYASNERRKVIQGGSSGCESALGAAHLAKHIKCRAMEERVRGREERGFSCIKHPEHGYEGENEVYADQRRIGSREGDHLNTVLNAEAMNFDKLLKQTAQFWLQR